MPLFRDHMLNTMRTPHAGAESRVNYVRYWINDAAGIVRLCLSDAPGDVASAVYRESHGILPGKIIEVVSGR